MVSPDHYHPSRTFHRDMNLPVISSLKSDSGQFRDYPVERLMRFLVALGHDVEIVVKPGRRRSAEFRVA